MTAFSKGHLKKTKNFSYKRSLVLQKKEMSLETNTVAPSIFSPNWELVK